MDYKKLLLEKIEKLIENKMSVSEFEKEYYMFYVDKVPDNVLTDYDSDFFGYVQEKLDWVAEKPDDEERKYGWINYDEYVEWVKRQLKNYKEGKEINFK